MIVAEKSCAVELDVLEDFEFPRPRLAFPREVVFVRLHDVSQDAFDQDVEVVKLHLVLNVFEQRKRSQFFQV